MPPTLIVASKFHEAWDSLTKALLDSKQVVAPRGFTIRELTPVTLHVEDLYENVLVNSGRDLNYRFMVAEWIWISLGRQDLAALMRYNKEMEKFSDNGITLYGAYGPRLGHQVISAIGRLKEDPDSRQACSVIWRPDDSCTPTKDLPCTISFQWLLRGKLHCIVTMRSSDVWLGLPYDFFTFAQITNMMAGMLGVEAGSITMNLGSSHIYEQHFQLADTALVDWKSYSLRSPKLNGWMPAPYMNGALVHAEPQSHLPEPWYSYAVVLNQPTKLQSLVAMKLIT